MRALIWLDRRRHCTGRCRHATPVLLPQQVQRDAGATQLAMHVRSARARRFSSATAPRSTGPRRQRTKAPRPLADPKWRLVTRVLGLPLLGTKPRKCRHFQRWRGCFRGGASPAGVVPAGLLSTSSGPAGPEPGRRVAAAAKRPPWRVARGCSAAGPRPPPDPPGGDGRAAVAAAGLLG